MGKHREAEVPVDFPHPKRMGSTKLFKRLYGNPTRSTWAKWVREGTIPPPDRKIGALSFWWEVHMWQNINVDSTLNARA